MVPAGGSARPRPLPTAGPVHLEATVRILQRRPANPVDRWDGTTHRRLVTRGGHLFLLAIRNAGTVEAPRLRFRVEAVARPGRRGPPSLRPPEAGELAPAAHRELRAVHASLLGLAADPSAFEARAAAEPALARPVRSLHGMRAPRYPELGEAFASVIPFQQVSLDAGAAIVGRIVARFGLAAAAPDGAPWFAFPPAERLAEAAPADLEACGLSARKAESLRALARLVADGALDAGALRRAPLADALATLRELPGIGPWSAGLVLLRGLGRLDAFPSGDVGVAKGLAALAGTAPTPAAAEAFSARFGVERGRLYFLTLGASLLGKGLIRPAP